MQRPFSLDPGPGVGGPYVLLYWFTKSYKGYDIRKDEKQDDRIIAGPVGSMRLVTCVRDMKHSGEMRDLLTAQFRPDETSLRL